MVLSTYEHQLNLADDCVHLYHFDFRFAHTVYRFFNYCSHTEHAQAKRFVFAKDEERYLCTHSLLRLVLSQYLSYDAKDLKFVENEYAKPSLDLLQNQRDIQFNITHSRDKLIIAVCRGMDIGVDIENPADDALMGDYAEFECYSPQENRHLSKLSGLKKVQYFYELWTLKEAFVKAMGIGLSYPLEQHTINVKKAAKANYKLTDVFQQQDWFLQLAETSPNQIISLASSAPLGNLLSIDLSTQLNGSNKVEAPCQRIVNL